MNLYEEELIVDKSKEHDFLIKYLTEEQRRNYSKIILELVQKYELKDFGVSEDKAYTEGRIIYNGHTIAHEKDSFTKSKIEKKFLNYLER